MAERLRIGIVGTGLKTLEYTPSWMALPGVLIPAAADPSARAREKFCDVFDQISAPRPACFESLTELLAAKRAELDMIYLATPHAFHGADALAVVEAGLDLLLEKPMVASLAEAEALSAACEISNSTVVVAYQGGLSPLMQETCKRIQAGDFGQLISIAGNIWEPWKTQYAGHWKHDPKISCGGFMFDTGAHLMNTVCLLAGQEFDRLSAFQNFHGLDIDITTAVAGQLKDGTTVTLNAAGHAARACGSKITLFFDRTTVSIDAWGQWVEIETPGNDTQRQDAEILDSPLLTFSEVVAGKQTNPSPISQGLRVAKLWDAIRTSAQQGGAVCSIDAT